MKLSAIQCRNAKPAVKPYKLTDGNGLYLEVMPTGSKYWRMQYRYEGKRPRLSFGVYPEVGLAEARDRRDLNRRLLRDGVNPAVHHRQEKRRRKLAAADTFELLAREWHTTNLSQWTPAHGRDIIQRFEKDIFREIGNEPINSLQAPDIIEVIRRIEARGAGELARRALQNIGRVYRYAIVTGRAETDPTYRMSEALKPQLKTHYAALESEELPNFVRALRANRARLFIHTLYATELLLLTFVRTGELIKATWDEFDLDEAEWRIPAKRMKMRRDHIVPLSRQVIERLKELQSVSAGRLYVFPHYSDPQKHLSNNTILKAIERLGYKGRTTGHGFRALAMSTIKEKLGYRHEVIDRQLAHQPHSKVDRAYDRAQFLDERRVMMQEWADYINACAAKS